jgi:hypothetical protein
MLTVHVTYKLAEYLQVLNDFLPQMKLRRAIAAGKQPAPVTPLRWYERQLVCALGSLAFAIKSYRIGACTFQIDSHGVSRESKTGLLQVPWSEITQVHKLSSAYLVEKSNGAMPIPFRVFTAEQQLALEALAGARLAVRIRET